MIQICFYLPYRYPGIVVYTDYPKLRHELSLFYNCSFLPLPEEDFLSITVKKNCDIFTIVVNGSTFDIDDPLQAISSYIMDNSRIHDKYYSFHAACMAINDKAYLFLAPTTTGKTTLSTYLAINGLSYNTDDCTVIDKTTFQVQPNSNPILLRDGGLHVLKTLGFYPLTQPLSSRHIFRPPLYIDQSLAIKGIFFIDRNEKTNEIVKIPQSKCIELLMKNATYNQELSFAYMKFLSKLAQINAYMLTYKDMSYVLDIVKSEENNDT